MFSTLDSSSSSVYSVFAATKRCNCSMKRNMRTVFGLFLVSLARCLAGCNLRESQPCWGPPFHQERRPFSPKGFSDYSYKSLNIVSTSLPRFCAQHTGDFPSADAALCILLFSTSAGAQTVVATVPATNDAAIWTGTPSENGVNLFASSWRFADVYLRPGQLRTFVMGR